MGSLTYSQCRSAAHLGVERPGRPLVQVSDKLTNLVGFRPFQSHAHKRRCQRPFLIMTRAEAGPALEKPQMSAKPKVKEQSEQTTSTPAPSAQSESSAGQVTIQYQREQAKAMRNYFKSLAYSEEVVKSKVFGWTPKNEINNGRWVMFGFAVGLLTEYATGVDFIQQLKLMVSYLGIADIYD